MNTVHNLVVVASSALLVEMAPAQTKFEDRPPSAQMRWLKPLPAPPKSLRPEASILLAPQAPVEGGIPNPYFTQCVFYDDFSLFTPQPDDVGEPPMLVPLQDGMLGVTWETGRDFIGMANDALFTALGGAPPVGLTPNGDPIERYIAFARETLDSGPITTTQVGMDATIFGFLLVGPGIPSQVTQPIYLQTDDGVPGTGVRWMPRSIYGASLLSEVFFGGVFESGFLSQFVNEVGVLDRFVASGAPFNFSNIFEQYASPKHPNVSFPTDQWFLITQMVAQSSGGGLGRGVWIKTAESVNSNPPFLDPRLTSGDLPPPDGDPNGWVCVYPGFEDDPTTIDVIEGIGIAMSQFTNAPTAGAFGLDQTSAAQTAALDGVRYRIGPEPERDERFDPNDVFFGPICFSGVPFERPCVIPDFVLPYSDDLEFYPPGQPIRIQTERWFDHDASNAIISTTQNTTPGGDHSLAQQNVNNDNILRAMFGTALPPGAAASPGAPLVAEANVRVAPTIRTARIIVLNDADSSGELSAFIALGGTDPTGAFDQADGRVYVRQPNPDFDPSQPAQDHLVQMHWLAPESWTTPPDPPLNLRHVLVPTGVFVSPGAFNTVRIEIEPATLSPDEPPAMRAFVGGQELFPHGDPKQSWVATSRTADSLEFWSGSNTFGQFDVIHVDDVVFDGPVSAASPGPAFAPPFTDGFSSYPPGESIHARGETLFLNPESVPVGPVSQNVPQVTIVPSPTAMPASGEPVCRYEFVENCLDELAVLPAEGSVIAVPTSALPPLPNGGALSCPGGNPLPFVGGSPFEVRDPMNGDRIGVGRWQLVDSMPTPFDPGAGDVVGFEFHFANEPIWRIAPPRNQGLIAPDPLEGVNQVLRVENIDGATDPNTETSLFESVDALLPEVVAAPEDFPDAQTEIELAFDLFIESVDVDGNPVVAPPRSRLALTVDSSGPDSGRIAEFIFGGPNAPGGIAPENISYLNARGEFVDTGVSLVAPSAGLSGPLVNTWLRVIVTTDHNGDWTLFIDEDRDGPAAPAQVAQGSAIDAGAFPVPNLAGLNSLTLGQGRDYAGAGDPITAPRSVRIRPGGAASIGPYDADPNDDYCFYEISYEESISQNDPPPIAEVQNDLDGAVTGIRALREGDVIAVLNKRTNPDDTVKGQPRVHERCPTLPFDEIERFELISEDGAEVVYEGRWKSMGLVGEPGVMLPEPAGGLTRPDGPIQDPPVSYNDPTAEPPGYPAPIFAREILLADWAMDAVNGAAPSEPPLPASRWYVDNLSLREIAIGTPCADVGGKPGVVDGADLAQLLSQWGEPNPPHDANFHESDFNNDGVVNGADLATLLANWGPCPD